MDYIVVSDSKIISINLKKKGSEEDSLIYKDSNGVLHTIDFATCASNYKKEHPESTGECIGDRNISEDYFVLYTSGVKTKIVFDKCLVCNHLLSGFKRNRFIKLQRMIQLESIYKTYDIT